MNIIKDTDITPQIANPVVAVGSFDGVHRGHRLLIRQMSRKAREIGGETVAVTFDPHPRQLLKGDNRLLSTIDEKLTLLAETGIDNVMVINFTRQFSQLSPEQFLETYIVGKLHTKIMITGQQHNFGQDRRGDLSLVDRYGIETCRLERYDNISSTQVRQLIEAGEMEEAVKLLGTGGYLVNLPLADKSKLLPANGDYLAYVGSDSREEQVITIENNRITYGGTRQIQSEFLPLRILKRIKQA